MNISFIAESIYPFNKGGAEKRIFDYSGILASNSRNTVCVISKRWWTSNEIKGKNKVQYVGICQRAEMYKSNGKRDVVSSVRFGIATFFYVLKSDNDILDIDIFPYFPLIFAKIATVFKKKKPIITCYWVEYWGKEYWKKYYKKMWFLGVWLEQISFFVCDKIVADSNFTKKQLQKAFDSKHKQIISIPPVNIDKDRINNVVVEQEKIYDIIYYGRIIEHKHVEYIVDITERLLQDNSKIKALIIGEGPSRVKIKSQIINKKLTNNIKIIDFVEKYDNLIKKIKSSKIMIQPSEREGFGITVVEANACGLPVMIMDCPNNAAKELVKNNYNGYVCKDIDDLYKKTKEILTDKNKLNKMSQNAKKEAIKYSKDVIRSKVLNYYSGLLKNDIN